MQHPTSQLTKREREVLGLVAQGKQNKEIACTLVITEAAVESHLHHIYRKLGVTNRTEAAALAWRSGWVDAAEA